MASPGVIVRPIHRLISGLPGWNPERLAEAARPIFDLIDFDDPRARLRRPPEAFAHPPGLRRPCSAARPAIWTLTETPPQLPWPEGRSDAWKGLDVSALEVGFFGSCSGSVRTTIARGENVSFTSDADAAITAVEKKDAQAAVLMRPTTVSDVEAVVGAGDRLPQKSTHFFPKMYSGIFGVSLEDAVY